MSSERQPINNLGSAFAVGCVTSTALSASIPAGKTPSHMVANVNTVSIRYTTDGTAPTSTAGILVAANGQISFMDSGFDYRSLIAALKFIQTGATATVDFLFYD